MCSFNCCFVLIFIFQSGSLLGLPSVAPLAGGLPTLTSLGTIPGIQSLDLFSPDKALDSFFKAINETNAAFDSVMNQKISDTEMKELETKKQGKKYNSIWDLAEDKNYELNQNATISEQSIRLAFCHVLNRCPGPIDMLMYSGAHGQSEARINELVRKLTMLPEFERKYVSVNSNSDAVDTLFLLLLGRLPNPAGRRNWQNVLKSKGYKEVVNQLIDSPEYKRKYGTTTVPGYGTCKGC